MQTDFEHLGLGDGSAHPIGWLKGVEAFDLLELDSFAGAIGQLVCKGMESAQRGAFSGHEYLCGVRFGWRLNLGLTPRAHALISAPKRFQPSGLQQLTRKIRFSDVGRMQRHQCHCDVAGTGRIRKLPEHFIGGINLRQQRLFGVGQSVGMGFFARVFLGRRDRVGQQFSAADEIPGSHLFHPPSSPRRRSRMLANRVPRDTRQAADFLMGVLASARHLNGKF